jgi:hypothetical protein
MGGGVPLTSEGQVIAGVWHTEEIERLTGRGLAVLIAPDASKRKGAPRLERRSLRLHAP